MSKLSPPYLETVQKYVKETGEDIVAVQTKIAEYAKKLRTKNLDVAAWAWVGTQGKAPPALKADNAPFTSLDKPWVTFVEALGPDSKIGENTGFNVRGYVFNTREWVSKKEGKPGMAVTAGDESGIGEVSYFGKQVETTRALGLQLLDSIFVSQAQLSKGLDGKLSIRCTGNYSETKKINPADKGLGPVTSIGTKPINKIQVWESAMIKAQVFDNSKMEYQACPNCNTKLKENVPNGLRAECPGNPEKKRPSCGQVISTKKVWTTLRVNDDDGEIACKFSPDFDIDGESLKYQTLYVVGRLNDRGDFNVIWYCPEDLVSKIDAPAPTPIIQSIAPTTTDAPKPIVPVVTASASNVIASSVPPTEAVGPVLIKWLKLFQPALETDIIEFALTKKKIPAEATKLAIQEMLDLGALAKEANGKIRLP